MEQGCCPNSRPAVPPAGVQVRAPELPYRPRDPADRGTPIGLIACGGITKDHLTAYRKAGYRVTAMCDPLLQRAKERRKEFYPEAGVCRDYHDLLGRDDVEVVDVAAHPPQRAEIIEEALLADKHVLSQKPFVLDLDFGQRMVELAEGRGLKLAVNQNGRWAPHFSYIREAIRAGLLGQVTAAHFAVHWDHNYLKGSKFEEVRHLILYDFAIHWFDILTCFLGSAVARRVYASTAHSPIQQIRPALLAQAVVEYEGAQGSLVFDADTRFGRQDCTYVTGSLGTIHSTGPDLKHQTLTLYTSEGWACPKLEGCWFPDGFHGTMGELLLAIEEDREPLNSGRNNLQGLALCFAAAASAERHQPVVPGSVRTISL
jgi:predicted dehydrogenase